METRNALGALALMSALLAPGIASAKTAAKVDSANHISGVRFDLHADLGGYVSFGAGFRADLPLIHSGLLARTDDELALSIGVDAYFANFYHQYYSGGPYVIPSAVLQWNFYLGPNWSVFPELGVALYVGNGDDLPRGLPVYAALDVGVGVRYHFSNRNALLFRVNRPTGLQIGVTF